MAKISLSTYTFNDATLVHALLASVPGWTVIPDEIVVTDDASEVPFTVGPNYPASLPTPRIIRLDENKGFTIAKHTGVCATTGDIFISLDSDARTTPNFLEQCLVHLRNPAVGMAAGNSVVDAGKGSIGLYLRFFGDNYAEEKTGPVDFIPGVTWAMRREVWDEVGGFSSHHRRNCGDHALCTLLREKGYQLIVDAGITVKQVRKLTRHAQCRRIWLWCGPPLVCSINDAASLPDQLQIVFGEAVVQRSKISLDRNAPVLLYYEILLMASMSFEFCAYPALAGRLPATLALALYDALASRLSTYPRLWHLLRADLLQLGILPLAPASTVAAKQEDTQSAQAVPPAPPLAKDTDWSFFLGFLDVYAKTGMLDWLNREGVRIILEEDAGQKADFSAYVKAGVI